VLGGCRPDHPSLQSICSFHLDAPASCGRLAVVVGRDRYSWQPFVKRAAEVPSQSPSLTLTPRPIPIPCISRRLFIATPASLPYLGKPHSHPSTSTHIHTHPDAFARDLPQALIVEHLNAPPWHAAPAPTPNPRGDSVPCWCSRRIQHRGARHIASLAIAAHPSPLTRHPSTASNAAD
jgi:hypothetical protein